MRLCFCIVVAVGAANAMEPMTVTQTPPKVASVVRADPQSGRLVRSVVINPKPIPDRVVSPHTVPAAGSPFSPVGIDEMVKTTAGKYNIDPLLVHSVIQVESNYNPYAISPKGAEGLMQLIPSTARRFGVKNSFDARENIEAGVKYLKYLQDLFGDDRKALAAYNAGEGAVTRYHTIPPYPETMNYVYQVGKKYGEARRAAESKRVTASDSEKPARDEHPRLEQYTDEQGRIYLRTR
ncbi:MAG TPA: lytic transglycosylase domain-containing protein [Bryobacteraceae bacterium]|nr:lytic transglycosylase domain-containing protein [Bryobacteraceae bacterium]